MCKEQYYIEWDERFILGIPIIDKQHEDLVRICNNLHWACLKDQRVADSRFILTANEAFDYARRHFSTEEKLMFLLDFSEFSEHKKEHENFIKEISSRYKQFEEGDHFAPNHFVHFLSEWIFSHITICDKKFADLFLSMNHYSKFKQTLMGRVELTPHPA